MYLDAEVSRETFVLLCCKIIYDFIQCHYTSHKGVGRKISREGKTKVFIISNTIKRSILILASLIS